MKKKDFEETMMALRMGLKRRVPIKPSKVEKSKKKYKRKVKHGLREN